MLGHHVGDLMGEDPDCCCCCCLQFMVKPYSVIMECIKGMNYVSCPVERERERERERKILLMTTPFSQQLAGLRVIILSLSRMFI
jgi:hypothetical protein